MTTLKENLFYVGVNDRNKQLFENLWPLPFGVSYNSYLIVDERVAIIDTVDVNFFETYLSNIKDKIGERKIDYLIVNHMEPDHSGAIRLMKMCYPEMKIVGNVQTLRMIEGFYGETENTLCVADGDCLSLGHHHLCFLLTPMIHWPETMMTFDVSNGAIFSGDAFGCFGALNGGITDTDLNITPFWDEMLRYYSNIVGKYGKQVQQALRKLDKLEVDLICPAHGPIWKNEWKQVVKRYDYMSRCDAEPGLVICYGSMYGNTLQLAELIARGASEKGLKDIVMHDVSKTNHSYIIADVFKYRGLVIGAPTYNGGLFPEMETLLNKLSNRNIRHRLFACFGSFTWLGQALKQIAIKTEANQWSRVEGPLIELRQGMIDEVSDACRILGNNMATSIFAYS